MASDYTERVNTALAMLESRPTAEEEEAIRQEQYNALGPASAATETYEEHVRRLYTESQNSLGVPGVSEGPGIQGTLPRALQHYEVASLIGRAELQVMENDTCYVSSLDTTYKFEGNNWITLNPTTSFIAGLPAGPIEVHDNFRRLNPLTPEQSSAIIADRGGRPNITMHEEVPRDIPMGQGILANIEAAGNTVTPPSDLTEADLREFIAELSMENDYPLTPEEAFTKEQERKIMYGTKGGEPVIPEWNFLDNLITI